MRSEGIKKTLNVFLLIFFITFVYVFKNNNIMRNIRNWTITEEAWLIENYKKFSVKKICKQLNRSYDSIRARANLLDISRPYAWRRSEILFVRDNLDYMTYAEMSKIIGRTVGSITQQVRRLKLKDNGLRINF